MERIANRHACLMRIDISNVFFSKLEVKSTIVAKMSFLFGWQIIFRKLNIKSLKIKKYSVLSF